MDEQITVARPFLVIITCSIIMFNFELPVYYSFAVVVLGLLVLILLLRRISKISKKRIAFLKKRSAVFPINTESPVDRPKLDFKEEGIENISKRFSIIRSNVTVLFLLIILILSIFPFLEAIPITILSVFTGAVAVIIGVASKPFIENYVSGVIIGLNKTFKIGDTILIDDNYGTIEDITMSSTIIKLWDWRRMVIPNVRMLNKEVINYTLHDNFIWMKVEFWVAFSADLEQVKQIAIESARISSFFADYEPPTFWVMSLEKDSYKCWVAAWSDSPARAWELGNDTRTSIITAFQQFNIDAHGFIIDYKSHLNGTQN